MIGLATLLAAIAVCSVRPADGYIIETILPQHPHVAYYDPFRGAGYGFDYKEYIRRHTQGAPIMIYTLNDCIPCRNTKKLLQQYYPDVPAYFMELGHRQPFERLLERDLTEITGQNTFPYIFVCGRFIGGSSDLTTMHNFGTLRPTINSCPAKGF